MCPSGKRRCPQWDGHLGYGCGGCGDGADGLTLVFNIYIYWKLSESFERDTVG